MGDFIRRVCGIILCTGFLTSLTYFSKEEKLQDTGELSISFTNSSIPHKALEEITIAMRSIEVYSLNEGWIKIRSFDQPLVYNTSELMIGSTFVITENILPAGIYGNIRIRVDSAFIKLKEGTKTTFNPESKNKFIAKGGFKVMDNKVTDLIIDWNLRNGIEIASTGEFILKPAMRIIAQKEAATVNGKYNYTLNADRQLMAHAYRSGEFSGEEIKDHQSAFINSFNSTTLTEDQSFIIPFLNRGTYDLIIAEHDLKGDFLDILYKYENLILSSGEVKDLELINPEGD